MHIYTYHNHIKVVNLPNIRYSILCWQCVVNYRFVTTNSCSIISYLATYWFTIEVIRRRNSRWQGWRRMKSGYREDVRGVAAVALATPFFQDLFYMPSRLLAILTSGYPDSWLSRLLAIRPSGNPVIRTFGHLVFWPSDHRAN